ncbi:hypothetical protein I7I50_04650 [Histoplasma capsulatum G186AR]|uniref:Uncharacterized protein n=1 Tax=Ajellomyces capsulatus TaxID=5037 RepID=A0A8H8CY56_AJECA|nr:hypothetical protein I7I52_05559 [Histoplasma capsulatum]QSS75499.1 hypothetical protein I7I50_04650 [Histoplasma capsulatum G186AR]
MSLRIAGFFLGQNFRTSSTPTELLILTASRWWGKSQFPTLFIMRVHVKCVWILTNASGGGPHSMLLTNPAPDAAEKPKKQRIQDSIKTLCVFPSISCTINLSRAQIRYRYVVG